MFEFDNPSIIHQMYIKHMFDSSYKDHNPCAEDQISSRQDMCRIQIMGHCIIN